MVVAEPVVWLSTVRPDGTPHLVPTWFCWNGDALFVFSKPNAVKVRNLRANPRLMVALGRPDEDFSVGLIEAEAKLPSGAAWIPDAFFAKYAAQLEDGGMDVAAFRASYTQVIRIAPTRFLPWRGRGERHEPVRRERTAPTSSRRSRREERSSRRGPDARCPGARWPRRRCSPAPGDRPQR
jgi:PPOX class probable F420-dependent enzyme